MKFLLSLFVFSVASVMLVCVTACKAEPLPAAEWSPPSDAAVTKLVQAPGHRWHLRIWDGEHHTRISATVRFTQNAATESCMAGRWKRLVVEVVHTRDERFFPMSDPLAYTIENGELVAGRAGVCDGYLFLAGQPIRQAIKGTYSVSGPGFSKPLGSFELRRFP